LSPSRCDFLTLLALPNKSPLNPPTEKPKRSPTRALDELEKPKDAVCLWSDHNQDLASKNFPAKDVYGVGTSFKEFVDSLRVVASHLEEEQRRNQKREELSILWGLRHFELAKLPTTNTIEEIERWIALLDTAEELTEEEALARFQDAPKSNN
jgi:hypothetical protein